MQLSKRGVFMHLRDITFKLIMVILIIACIISAFIPAMICSDILKGFIPDIKLLKIATGKIYMTTSLFVLAILILFFIVICFVLFKAFEYINNALSKLNSIDSNINDIKLPRTKIYEFDSIIEKTEVLLKNAGESILNIDKISNLTGILIGSFEIDYTEHLVTVSNDFAALFDIFPETENSKFVKVPFSKFEEIKNRVISDKIDGEPHVYYINTTAGKKYFDIFINRFENKSVGFAIDVTSNLIQKFQVKYERKFDALTGLYTREMFIKKVSKIIESNKNGLGCFVTAELENLKKINDIYGHKIGDEFIKMAAKLLSEKPDSSIIGKKSGYEFLIFIHGYKTKDEIKDSIELWIKKLNRNMFIAPDSREFKLKLTSGYCFYPNDADDIDKLIQYSAFALYEAKNLYKDTVHAFSLESYNRDKFIETKIEAFEEMIDENDISYLFQPIINLHNGSIYGYEAFMRPNSELFSSPKEILEIASEEKKLYLIEKITVTNCLDIVSKNKEIFKSKKFFYNTDANQILNHEDQRTFIRHFSEVAHMMVCEISNLQGAVDNNLEKKCEILRYSGTRIALDGFSIKNNNIQSLISLKPDYIKIDRSLITDIDIKNDKQSLVAKFIKTAKENNIIVIAVGVETRNELSTLIKLGVDFAQGFYFSLPKKRFIEKLKPELEEELFQISNDL